LGALSAMAIEPARAPLAVGSKVTEMVQLAAAARVVPQVLVWAKLEALVPATLMPVMFMEPVPVLVRVTVWAAVVVPTTCWVEKARDEAERPATGAVPVPLSATVCGEVETLSAKEIEPERVPVAVGSKLTEMVQLVVGARVVPQVFDSAKLEALVPPSVMPVMFTGAPPVLVAELVRVKV
jgi:hypothetical protein